MTGKDGVTSYVPINSKARKPKLPEEKRTVCTNFIENQNRTKMQSLLANITQTSQITDSLSKETANTLCNKFSEILVIIITMGVIQQTATKNHGSDTSVLSHVKPIIAQRKCMLNTLALLQRLQWCPQAKCTKGNLIISFVNTKKTHRIN